VRGAAVIAAVVAAAAVSVFTVHFLTQYFKTRTLRPFGYYCLAFGAFMVGFTLIAGAP
jgi:undecaprenyl pyrophosphate phosphatase UppP